MKSGRSISAFIVGVLLFIALGTQALAATTYTVKAGDWLSKIAKSYGVTVEQLKRYNSLKSDTIYPGQQLIVTPDTKYIVKKGDTLWLIASRQSTTVEAIKARNKLKSDAININQVLYIPSAAKSQTPAPAQATPAPGSPSKAVTSWPSVTYIVKAGDTLTGIAKKYNTTVEAIMKYNYMDPGEWLNEGQKAAINGYAPRNFAVTPGESSSPKKVGKLVDWFLDGKYLIKRNDVFIVTDVATGLQIRFKMMGGANHADVEPLTSDETAKMKKLFPAWTWTPRPVVIFHKGINFAASLSGMPHSFDTISNNVDGHFDLYLYNSKNHGESVSQSYVKQHLDNVLIAAGK
jgi:LysM repeat protein